ncbi:MAG: DUF262 domain-containing HNH endonuclease family protein [Bacteroidales bacterium]|nr:DUF262 domain-containing HNH endonuclease family protein [Bacteroidales bacterium]
MKNKQYLSSSITLCDIVNKNILFNIPIYQRLYVWKELQVNKLLEDIFDAYSRKEDNYYLGGVVTYSNGDKLDLIDGQQRFTTLWLICMVISSMEQNVCDKMKMFCGNEQELRIQFAIRPQITKFLMSHVGKEKSNDDAVKQESDVENMIEAIGNIKAFCESKGHKEYLTDFASFIMEKVILVRTEIPEETDLNKLFELINGRGQQLSQTDILKSHILNLIRKETNENEDLLIRYGQIWNACADMNEFVEHNIQQEDPSLSWKDRLVFDKESVGNEEGIVADFGNDFFDKYIQTPVNDDLIDQPESLFNVVLNSSVEKEDKKNNEDNSHLNSNGREIRSIVSFQMLLLYTLRIFLIENKLKIYGKNERYDIDFFNEKSLLKIFEPAVKQMEQDKSAQTFIKLLWMVRVLFDKNVVKWIKEDGETEEVLTIRTLRISMDQKGNLKVHRDSANSGNRITEMTQLQSILYFSQPRIYELWLCPFLYHSFSENDPNDLLKYLQQLDNVLLCLPYEKGQDMLWRTYHVMINGLGNHKGEEFYNYFCQLAEQEDGCKFAHYLFYKMEYMLWWKNKRTKEHLYWNEYRLSSRNSVEHINPQTRKYNQSQISYLNTFGNLVLVSREVNSSYSNKSFKEKQAQFIDKRDNGHQIDSLKSDIIYSTRVEEWGDNECEQHLREMENIASDYFSSTAKDYQAISEESNLIRKWVSKEYRDNKIQLLAAVFAKATGHDVRFDAGSGYFRLPNEEEIFQLPFISYLYEQRNHLIDSTEGIDLDEFTYPENYYFAKYTDMINYIMQGKYYSEDNGRIVLVNGQRIGSYNFKEVLLCILCSRLENDSFEVNHWADTLFLYIYFDGNRFTTMQQDEYITLKCWFDYENHCMLYEVEVNDDNSHKGRRTRILRANNWEFNDGRNLYLKSQPELHRFHSGNRDFESIALKCERDIRDIVNKILSYE